MTNAPRTDELVERIQQLERDNLALRGRVEQLSAARLDSPSADSQDSARALVLARAAIESTGAAILIMSCSGDVIMHNRKFSAMWSLPDDWAAIRTREARFGPLLLQVADPHGFVVRLLELEASPDHVGYDLIGFVDGRVVERYAEPYRVDGEIVGRLYSHLDVTERELAQAEMEASRAQLASIFNNAAVGVALLTPDGTCTLVNKHFATLVGQEASSELLWTPFSKLIHSDDSESVELMLAAQLLGECSTARFEVRMLTGGSGEIAADVTLSPIRDAQGAIEGITAIVLDVTERKRADAQRWELEAKMQQIRKFESLGVLAGGIAHDFNNLLTGILGYADIALYDVHDVDTVLESFEQIRSSARRAADLAGQMLAYSGQGRFVLEAINLGAMLRSMNHELLESISKRLVLRYEADENLPVLMGDPQQIRQVIRHLIVNASEASEGRAGTIVVRLGSDYFEGLGLAGGEVLEELPAGNYVFFEVQDFGVGMSNDVAVRAFEPFFSTKFTGRGLGLAAVLGIVRGHKGSIQVHSELGQGSTFRVLFPSHAQEGGLAVTPARSSYPWPGLGEVLLVNDDEILRAFCRQGLQNAGFEVVAAASGKEAMELARSRSERIRLVIVDLSSSLQAIAPLLEDLFRLLPSVCAIVASKATDSRPREPSILARATPLTKPYEVDALVQLSLHCLGLLQESGA